MRFRRLKAARVAVSAIFLALTALVFLDPGNSLPPAFSRGVLFLQFVPSLLSFSHGPAPGAAGWLAVAVLTVLAGRVYCSTICPLGTLQDAVGFAARKLRRKAGYRFTKPERTLRYILLACTALPLAVGIGLPLDVLDPFSGFGRIMAHLVRPVVILATNLAAAGLEQFGLYTLARAGWGAVSPLSAGLALALLGLVVWLAATRGRRYCNTVCPVGAVLGLVARVSALRVGLDAAACRECGRCETACKGGCLDLRSLTVDASRCVACCNCLAACPHGAARIEYAWRSKIVAGPDQGRRDFLVRMSLLGLAGPEGLNATALQARPTTVPEGISGAVSPPGSVDVGRFTSLCTACHLCVSVCPSRVLTPSLLEYGPEGIMQPRLNNRAGFCNYECTLCSQVCPTGAILPLTPEDKKLTQIGVARFIRENCVVVTDNTSCGACSEHCPTKAVRMVPYPNPANKPLVVPEVIPDYCVGCGACEHACPTKPFKAICVDANPVHRRARKPDERKTEFKTNDKAAFPF